MKIKLTKTSERELRGWHAGSGIAFISAGTGDCFHYFDMRFFRRGNVYKLSMGNSKSITLTDEQSKTIGTFAIEDN